MFTYLKTLYNVIKKPLKVKAFPLHLQLEPTTFCNLRCKMCIRNEIIDNSKHLSYDDFLKIFKEVSPKKITFAGAGEPTLNPDLVKMISYAANSKTSTMISSNMTIGDKIAIDLINSKLGTIKVSIDSATSETYIKVRGEDKFSDIIQGVEKLNYYKDKLNMPNPDIRFDFVVLKENYKEIPELFNIASKLKIKNIYFRPLQSFGLNDETHSELIKDFDFDDLLSVFIKSFDISRKQKIRTNLSTLIREYCHIKNIYLNRDGLYDNRICLLPWFQVFISTQGDVSFCCALSSNMGISIGNIFKQSFSQIWNSKKSMKIRNDFRNKVKYKICRDCIPRDLTQILSMSRLLPTFIKNK